MLVLDFTKDFVVVTDACSIGIGAILSQENHPISYHSCKLMGKMRAASTYVKEMFVISQTVGKWRHYLLGRQIVIKTDHRSLKNLLSEVMQTPERNNRLFFVNC